MLEQKLEEIMCAIRQRDYESARALASEACEYAKEHRIRSDLLEDLAIVAHARTTLEFADAFPPCEELAPDYAALGKELYHQVERAARDIGLPEAEIAMLLGGTVN